MTTNALKSQIAQDYVEFLGHKIGQGYRTPAELLLKTLKSMLPRKMLDLSLALLDTTNGMYRNTELCAPLTDSLKKSEPDPVSWNP